MVTVNDKQLKYISKLKEELAKPNQKPQVIQFFSEQLKFLGFDADTIINERSTA